MKKRQPKQSLVEERTRKKFLRRKYHKYNLKAFYIRDDRFHTVILRDRAPDERLFITKESPVNFSILTNRAETVNYLNLISGMLEHRTHTCMNLSKVQHTDLPTICVLGALLLKHKESPWEVKIPRPNYPNGKIWHEVQFDRMILRERRQFFTSGSFLSRTSKTINTPLIEAILDATVDYFGESRRAALNELSAIINEVIENTTWHADPKNLSSVPWIINTRITGNAEVREMEYCIVDLGVGIYESIKENVTQYNTKKARALHRLSEIFDNVESQSSFLSRKIPGGIGSRTNQDTRGKGVRHIHQVAQSSMYDKFDIITNKARVNLKDLANTQNDSPANFFGTIYYWKIRFDE